MGHKVVNFWLVTTLPIFETINFEWEQWELLLDLFFERLLNLFHLLDYSRILILCFLSINLLRIAQDKFVLTNRALSAQFGFDLLTLLAIDCRSIFASFAVWTLRAQSICVNRALLAVFSVFAQVIPKIAIFWFEIFNIILLPSDLLVLILNLYLVILVLDHLLCHLFDGVKMVTYCGILLFVFLDQFINLLLKELLTLGIDFL